ncbi:MAG TPA: pitrilysin family protein [Caulobacterales bacterium]|nr:pitrilysin family protein [Caulobacterales bacterium]
MSARFLRSIAMGLALALSAVAPALAQSRADSAAAHYGVQVERVVSPGGIEAWLVSDSTVPIIVFSAYWKGGAATEQENVIGVSSVMADMLTEGAGDMNANAFKERLETLNMSLGFSADWDGVSMGLVTLSENRDAAFEMARLALMQPRFDAEPLERIRRQMLVGLRTRETNPNYIANLALDRALYPSHPYARRSSRANVMAIDKAAIQQRRAQLLTRDRILVTAVGDIDAATLGRLLDRTFGALPSHAPVADAPDAALQPATPLIVRPLPQPQSLILFSAPGLQFDDPDWIPLAVANYILGGGGFSSRLMNEVREKRGLVYGIGTGSSVRDHVALIRGSAQSENADVAEAIQVTRDEIAKLYRDGPTQQEVDDAITYLTGSFALDLDSDSGIASVLHGYHVVGRDMDYINKRNDMLRAVTLADVNRVIRRLYNPDNFTFVVVGQPEGLEPSAQR